MRLKDVDPTCGMTLNECLSSVAEFHSTFGLRVEEQPNLQLTAEEMSLRHSLMAEENDEYLDAVRAGDMVEVADALGDMLYILCGTIISHGMQDVMSNVFRHHNFYIRKFLMLMHIFFHHRNQDHRLHYLMLDMRDQGYILRSPSLSDMEEPANHLPSKSNPSLIDPPLQCPMF